jgi:hypothetical protein
MTLIGAGSREGPRPAPEKVKGFAAWRIRQSSEIVADGSNFTLNRAFDAVAPGGTIGYPKGVQKLRLGAWFDADRCSENAPF